MEKWSISAEDSDSLAPSNGPTGKILREIAWLVEGKEVMQVIESGWIEPKSSAGQHRPDFPAEFIQRVRFAHEVFLSELLETRAGLGRQVAGQNQDFHVRLG